MTNQKLPNQENISSVDYFNNQTRSVNESNKIKTLWEWSTSTTAGFDYNFMLKLAAYITLEMTSIAVWSKFPMNQVNSLSFFSKLLFTHTFIEIAKEKTADLAQQQIFNNYNQNLLTIYKQIPAISQNTSMETAKKITKEISNLAQHSDLWAYQSMVMIRGAVSAGTVMYCIIKNLCTLPLSATAWSVGLFTTHYLLVNQMQPQADSIKSTGKEIINIVLSSFNSTAPLTKLNHQVNDYIEQSNPLKVGMALIENSYQLISMPATFQHLRIRLPEYKHFMPAQLPANLPLINKFIGWWMANYPRINEWKFRANDINEILKTIQIEGIMLPSDLPSTKNIVDNPSASSNHSMSLTNIWHSIANPWDGLSGKCSDFIFNKAPIIRDVIFYQNESLDWRLIKSISIAGGFEVGYFYLLNTLRNIRPSNLAVANKYLQIGFIAIPAVIAIKEYAYGEIYSTSLLNGRNNVVQIFDNGDIYSPENKKALAKIFYNIDPLASQGTLASRGIFSFIGPVIESSLQLFQNGNGAIAKYLVTMFSANMFLTVYYSTYFSETKAAIREFSTEPFLPDITNNKGVELIEKKFAEAFNAYIKIGNIKAPLVAVEYFNRFLDDYRGIEPLSNLLQQQKIDLGLGTNSLAGFKAYTQFTKYHLSNYFRITDLVTKASEVADGYDILLNFLKEMPVKNQICIIPTPEYSDAYFISKTYLESSEEVEIMGV